MRLLTGVLLLSRCPPTQPRGNSNECLSANITSSSTCVDFSNSPSKRGSMPSLSAKYSYILYPTLYLFSMYFSILNRRHYDKLLPVRSTFTLPSLFGHNGALHALRLGHAWDHEINITTISDFGQCADVQIRARVNLASELCSLTLPWPLRPLDLALHWQQPCVTASSPPLPALSPLRPRLRQRHLHTALHHQRAHR